MKFELWARIKCDVCHCDEDWEMSFHNDKDDLVEQAEVCGWGVLNGKQLCEACINKMESNK